jgi:hypothetical protein
VTRILSGKDVADDQDFDEAVAAFESNPVLFEVGGRKFALRHLKPSEYDRMNRIERVEYRLALEDEDIKRLADSPETVDAKLKRARRIGYLEAALEREKSLQKSESIDAELAALIRSNSDWHSSAEEVAETEGLLARDKWVLSRCILDGNTMEPLKEGDSPHEIPSVFEQMRVFVWLVISAARKIPKLS